MFYVFYICRVVGSHTSAPLFFYFLSLLVLLLFLIKTFVWNLSVLNIHSINDQHPGWALLACLCYSWDLSTGLLTLLEQIYLTELI